MIIDKNNKEVTKESLISYVNNFFNTKKKIPIIKEMRII